MRVGSVYYILQTIAGLSSAIYLMNLSVFAVTARRRVVSKMYRVDLSYDRTRFRTILVGEVGVMSLG